MINQPIRLHELVSNGKKYVFHVLRNSTEPCPQCGVPACGKEDILWFETNGKRMAIIFDGGYLDLAIGDVISANANRLKDLQFPVFIRDWNESKGWVDCDDYDGYNLDIEDFITTLNLLKNGDMGKWITVEDILEMENLANEARIQRSLLKIVRG